MKLRHFSEAKGQCRGAPWSFHTLCSNGQTVERTQFCAFRSTFGGFVSFSFVHLIVTLKGADFRFRGPSQLGWHPGRNTSVNHQSILLLHLDLNKLLPFVNESLSSV